QQYYWLVSALSDQAFIAQELSRSANADPSRKAVGFTDVEWFKNAVKRWQDVINVEVASGFGGGEQYYCMDAEGYSQGVQDKLFQDPDGTPLNQLLQEEIK